MVNPYQWILVGLLGSALWCAHWDVCGQAAAAEPKVTLKPPPKPGTEKIIDCAEGVRLTLCWIPAGKATLGVKPGERTNLDTSDLDPYPFTTEGFWLGKYEVTQAKWLDILRKNPSYCSPAERGPVLSAG